MEKFYNSKTQLIPKNQHIVIKCDRGTSQMTDQEASNNNMNYQIYENYKGLRGSKISKYNNQSPVHKYIEPAYVKF